MANRRAKLVKIWDPWSFLLHMYLFQHEFITGDQSAYRSGHFTETALHRVMPDLLDGTNDGLYSGMCFFDLAKCFETIDRDILLLKLKKIRI